jgi:hypothetical protein
MSNRVVTYIDINLNSVEEYWDALIVPSIQKFQTEPSTPALFHAATDVWHLHDWVWHDQNPGQDSHGFAFSSYRAGLLVACPELGWLRDIADARKHRGLGRLPEVKGAEPHMVGYLTPMLPLTEERLEFFLVLNDGSKEPVDQVLRNAIEFWRRELKAKNLPSPYT